MEMGFLLELLLTAALSVLLAFLLGKIFATDSSDDDPEEKRERSAETVGEIHQGAVDGDEDRRRAGEILELDSIAAEPAAVADKASQGNDDEADGGIVLRSEDDVLVDHSLEVGFGVGEKLGLDEDSASRMSEGFGFEEAHEEGRSEEVRANEIDLESVSLEMKKEEPRIHEGNVERLEDESTGATTEEGKKLRLERLPKMEERLINDADVTELEPAMGKGEENKPEVNVLILEDESSSELAEVEMGRVERLLKEEGSSEEVMASVIETPEIENEQEKISEINVVRLESTREMLEKVAPKEIKEGKGLLMKEECLEESRASDLDMEKKTDGESQCQVSLLSLKDDSMREIDEVVVEEAKEEQKLFRGEERLVEVTSSNVEQDKEIEQEHLEAKAVKLEEDSIQAMPEEVEIDRVVSPNLVGREERLLAEGEVCTSKHVQSPEEERILQEGSRSEAKEQKICIHDEGSLLNEEDDWEGIEKTELEKRFGAAIAYAGSCSGGDALSKLSSDVQMQLYGLQKVAIEGPCYELQPLPLKVSARAKWHAWQKLGNMNPDMAMEQYMTVLSENIPGWIGGKPGEGNTDPETMISGMGKPDSFSTSHDQHSLESKRNVEGPSLSEEEHATAGSEHQKKES